MLGSVRIEVSLAFYFLHGGGDVRTDGVGDVHGRVERCKDEFKDVRTS